MTLPDYRELVRFDDAKMAKINLFESSRMFVDLYCLQPAQQQKPHRHEANDKIYFVLEGSATFLVGDAETVLGPGESCAAPAGELHGVRNDSDRNAVLLVAMAPHPDFRGAQDSALS